MGRAKQTNRNKKKLVFKTSKARESWKKTKSDPKWQDLKSYKPSNRLWIVTKEPVGDLYMVDAQSFVDEDGDHLYRVVFQVSNTGKVYTKYGQVHVFDTYMIRASEVGSIVDETTSKRLDEWVKSAREDVKHRDPATGFVDHIAVIDPCPIEDIKGWKRISEEEAKANLVKNVSFLTRLFLGT